MAEVVAPLNGYAVKYISDDDAFQEAIAKLEKAPTLALDLEFDDNRYTYGLTLCLIQVADLDTCYLIDPFGITSLKPLWNIIQEPAVMKIFHSASNDILLLKKLGCQPRNILDTEIASKVLNYGRTSFANMMAALFNIEIDKSYQVSNWNIRPLFEEQLNYAAADVVYLHALKDRLLSQVELLNRLDWVQEECRLLEGIEQKGQTDRYLKLRGADRLTYFELYILKQLYDFRESLAIKLNKPSGSVIPNEVLVNLVLEPLTDYRDWQNTKGLMGRIKDHAHYKLFQKAYQEAEAQARALNISMERPPRPRRPDYLVTREEADRRKSRLQPVRLKIIEEYGEFTASLLFPQGLVNDYAEGKPLEIKKNYARQVVEPLIQHFMSEEILPDDKTPILSEQPE
ncbi:ribonuclease D [Adhaeribacter rhizoryzae]|uniref:Ribonuclease D n=1 Tax=Adhaeribacter rhizoryzae TaxID=2607907 RepID=A0A5M6DUG6_9BACT|nr:ribonuclease D [Adhaeribacter rhizoryzae]KAA5549085.1 ribonuclease D [Adhaeribacter rhizoryzae]